MLTIEAIKQKYMGHIELESGDDDAAELDRIQKKGYEHGYEGITFDGQAELDELDFESLETQLFLKDGAVERLYKSARAEGKRKAREDKRARAH